MREVPREQVLKRLATENPWWREPFRVPEPFGRWRARGYLELFFPLVYASRVRRAVLLMGPRRVGKTVLLHHVIQRLLEKGVAPRRICYFSVDHPLYNGVALEELIELFAEATGTDPASSESYVFFDEIQYRRQWEVHLKAIVDGYRRMRLTASGSAAAALKLKSLESGAGRFTDFLLPPLTFHEYRSLLGLEELVESENGSRTDLFRAVDVAELNRSFVDYLNFGGYPEAVFSPEIQADPGRFIKSDIIDKVLLRDLPSLYGIQDIQELNALFTTLAFNTGGVVSLEELSQGSGVAKNTLKKYVEYLEAAFLVRVVHRVDRDARRFKRATTFKVYLTNPSMRAALFSPVTADDPETAALVETALFCQWFHSDPQIHRLHYARWKRGEIDLVSVGRGGRPEWAVEVKWSDRIADQPQELSALVDFCRRNDLEGAVVTTRTRREATIVDGTALHFVPAAEYGYSVGRNLLTRKSEDEGGASRRPG